jgi:hypothetical protein
MRRIVDTTAPRLLLLAGAMVIIGVCAVTYTPAIRGGFIWDDDVYVTANPMLTAPGGFYQIWFLTDTPPTPQYVPLVYTTVCTTFWVEHRLWGFNPMGYHIVNVAIHIINALLLWLVLRRLAIPGAWFASAVWALHPVNVESVAWITERKNVLMLFFSLLSVLCWVEFAVGSRAGRKAILFYAGSLLFGALALFSKATACTLPAALVLILWLKHIALTAKRWLQVVPFVVMGIGMGILVMWREERLGTGFLNMGLGPAEKLLTAGRALWFYLAKLFWPVNLTFSYPRWDIDPTAIWQYAWPAASVLVLACAWLWRERSGRAVTTAILFFAAMLFPMLGFFSLYTFVYCFVADHYQYAAAIGPVALVAAGGACALRRLGTNGKTVMLSAASIVLLTLGVLTWRQCRIYTNNETLWLDTLRKNPDSWLAHSQIGEILFRQGKVNEARLHMERVLELASYVEAIHPRAFADLHRNLAAIFEAQGKFDDAAGHYQKALEIFENVAMTHYQLAEVLVRMGRTEQAIPHYRRALEIAEGKKADRLAEEIRQQLKSVEEHK